jgi:hypothetical protein
MSRDKVSRLHCRRKKILKVAHGIVETFLGLLEHLGSAIIVSSVIWVTSVLFLWLK